MGCVFFNFASELQMEVETDAALLWLGGSAYLFILQCSPPVVTLELGWAVWDRLPFHSSPFTACCDVIISLDLRVHCKRWDWAVWDRLPFYSSSFTTCCDVVSSRDSLVQHKCWDWAVAGSFVAASPVAVWDCLPFHSSPFTCCDVVSSVDSLVQCKCWD